MNTFTPAPWERRLFSGDSSGVWSPSSGKAVAFVDGRNEDEIQANARLIAIAPELFEACQLLIAHCDKYPPMGDSIWSVQLIRKAIAKATREAA